MRRARPPLPGRRRGVALPKLRVSGAEIHDPGHVLQQVRAARRRRGLRECTAWVSRARVPRCGKRGAADVQAVHAPWHAVQWPPRAARVPLLRWCLAALQGSEDVLSALQRHVRRVQLHAACQERALPRAPRSSRGRRGPDRPRRARTRRGAPRAAACPRQERARAVRERGTPVPRAHGSPSRRWRDAVPIVLRLRRAVRLLWSRLFQSRPVRARRRSHDVPQLRDTRSAVPAQLHRDVSLSRGARQ